METKTQNTILRVTHDCDLSDVIVGLIRGHRGTKGCTMREIHKFLHNDYFIEVADDIDFFRHLFVSCKKLIKNGRLFKHGCKYRVSYSELSQDQMPNDLSLVMDKSAEKASVYVCELCKENDEGKKALEISFSMTKDISQSELLQLTSLPNKCFLCHSTYENDRLYLDSTLPDNSFNSCADADVALVSCPPSATSPVHSLSSVPGSGLNSSLSDRPLVSGDTRSAVLDDVQQSGNITDKSSLPAMDRDSLKLCSNSELQSNRRLGDGLKSCDTSEHPSGGSEKRNETKVRQTKNRRTQVKFLTDGLTPFYSSEGKRKRPSNVTNSASLISPSKAKRLRDRTTENEEAGEELSFNHKRLKRMEKQRNSTSFDAGADARKSRKMSATSAESHGTYQLLVGIKEDILFPHITGEDVKLFETARTMALQRLQQKLYNIDILSAGTELVSVNSPPCQNRMPNILLPPDYEDDTSSRTLIDGSSTVQGYDQSMNESVEAMEASQALSSNECSHSKNNDNETSFRECDGADDHEFSDDDNNFSSTPVIIKENTLPDAATGSDTPCGSNDAEDVSAKADDILEHNGAMEHHVEELSKNETVDSAGVDETIDDNSIPAIEANTVLSFQNENVEVLSTDLTAGRDIAGIKMIAVDNEDTRTSTPCTGENNVAELHEDVEVVCPNISEHVVEGTAHNTASAYTDDTGFSNVEISLVRGIDAASLNTSVGEADGLADENLFVHDGIDVLVINASDDKSHGEDKEDEIAAGAMHENASNLLNCCPRNDESLVEIICKESMSHSRTNEIPNNNDDDKDCGCEDTVDGSAKELLNVEVTISALPVSSSDGIRPCDTLDCTSNGVDNESESTALESTEQFIADSVISNGESFSGHVTSPDKDKDIEVFEKEVPMEQELPIVASTEESFINHLCVSMESEKTTGKENMVVAACDQASVSFLENSDSAQAISDTRDQDVIEARASPNQEDSAHEACVPSAATEQLVLSSGPCLDSFMEDFKWTSNEESIADQNCTKETETLYFDQDEGCVHENNCSNIAFLSVEILQSQDKKENSMPSTSEQLPRPNLLDDADTVARGEDNCKNNCSNIAFLSVEILQSPDKKENSIPSTSEQLPRPNLFDDADTVARGEEAMDQTPDEALPSKRNRKRKLMFCPDGCCSFNNTDVHCKVMKTNDSSPKTRNGNDIKHRHAFQQSPRRRGRPKKDKGFPSDELKSAGDVSPSVSACMLDTLEVSVAADAKVNPCSEEPGVDSTSASEAAVSVESRSVTDVIVPNCSYATIASDALIALGPLVSHQAPSSHDIVYRKVAATETCDPTAVDSSCDILVDNAHFLTAEASGEREACTLAFSESKSFVTSEISVTADAVACSRTLPSDVPAVSKTLVSRDESVFGELVQGFDSLSSTKQSGRPRDSSVFGSVLLEQWNGLEETVVNNNERTGFSAVSRGLEASRACSMTEEENVALLNSAARDVVASYKSHEMNAAYVASGENNSWVASNELSVNASGRDIVNTLADVLSSHATKLDGGITDKNCDSSNIEVPQMDAVHHQCSSLPDALSSEVYSSCLVVSESESQNMIVHFSELSSTLESKSPTHRPERSTMSAENSVQVELLDKKELLGLMKLNNLLPSEPEKNDFVATTKAHNCAAAHVAVEDFNVVKLGFHENVVSDSYRHPSSASAIQECYVPFDSLSAGCQVQNSTEYQLQSENQIQMAVLPPDNHVQLPSDTSQMILRLVDPNAQDCRAPLLGLNSEMYVATSCRQVPTAAYVTGAGVSNVQSGNLLNNGTSSIQTPRQMDIASFLGGSCITGNAAPASTATNASSSVENGIQESLLHVQPSNLLYALPLQSAMLVNSLGRVYSADASLINVPSNLMYVLPVQSMVAGVNFEAVESTETANKNLCNKPESNNPGAGVTTTAQCPLHFCNGRGLVPQLLGCQPCVIICPGTIPMSNILQPLSESLGQCHPHSCPSAGARNQAGHGSVLGNFVSPLPQYTWGMPSQNISAPNVVPAAKPSTEMNSGGGIFVLSSENQQQVENRCSGPQMATINICGNTFGTQVLNSINASQFVSENLLAQQFVATQNLSVQLGQMTDTSAIALQVQAYSPCK